MTHLFNPGKADKTIPDIGAKGLNLFKIEKICRVPKWFAVPAEIFVEILRTEKLDSRIKELLRGLTAENVNERSAKIHDLICTLSLPDELLEKIRTMLAEVTGDGALVAVRASVAGNEGSQLSFAGLYKSFLNIKGQGDVCFHIRKVWASGYDSSSLIYRSQNKLPLHPVPMAVVVQRMVCAKTSGVMLTVDPVTKNPMKVTISALYGLGEGLVRAGFDADNYYYDKETKQFSTVIGVKDRKIEVNGSVGSGVYAYDVDEELQTAAALSSKSLDQAAKAALRIEEYFGHPQDIEFCFDEFEQLSILQTRDIASVKEYGPAAGNHQIWDNSNIIDSYSGVTSPMTFSFVRNIYTAGYHAFSKVTNIPSIRREENEQLCRSMPGLFHGRVYFNIFNWYQLVTQIPGYNICRNLIESMAGVNDKKDDFTSFQKGRPSLFMRIAEYPRMVVLAVATTFRFMTLRVRVPLFVRRVDRYLKSWNASEFSRLKPHELMRIYNELEKQMLRKWQIPVVNDLYVKFFCTLLKFCCKKWCVDKSGELHNRLLCSENGTAETEPARQLMQLAVKIKSVDSVKYLFQTSSPEELAAVVPSHKDCKEIFATIESYLKIYGFRCINELKLEEPTLVEKPEFLYLMLKNYINLPDSRLDVNAMFLREVMMRSEAMQMAFKPLAGLRPLLFRFVLKQARRGMLNSKNLNYARRRMFGMVRQIMNAVGEALVREDIIDNEQEIYYLTMDEVWDYIKGTAVTANLRSLIEMRHGEYDHYCSERDAISDRFSTYGMVYNRNTFLCHGVVVDKLKETNRSMHGTGCAPGRVKGKARVVHSPGDDMQWNREILVASRVDPGWLLLYPTVSAILIEHGNILSNAAIMAREMGIPAIVGIPGLLDSVHDGMLLSIDATEGTVIVA